MKWDMSKLIWDELKVSSEVVKSLSFRKIGKGKYSVLVNVTVSRKLNTQSTLNKLCFRDLSLIHFSKFDNDKEDPIVEQCKLWNR